MRSGINHIDKFDFLEAYPVARSEAFGFNTIKNSFSAAGLVPLNPQNINLDLNIDVQDQSLSLSRGSDNEPQTPSNTA